MRQIQVILALALLLFTGLNCGTENPVQETTDTPTVEVPKSTLHGEVQTIEGVLIQVRLLKNGQLLTQTETETRFELTSLEAGSYTVQISAKGYETQEVEVTLAPGQIAALDKVALVALEIPVSHLRGVLTDAATGAPLGEVGVQLTDASGNLSETLTTETGVFTFENLAVEQNFTLAITHPGYEATEMAVPPIPAAETLELHVELTRPAKPIQLDPGQGLSLGSQGPDFELSDGDGKQHALANYIGEQKVVLVFFRGGW